VPVDVVRQRHCPASSAVDRRATRGCVQPADPPKVEEIVAVVRPPVTPRMAAGCAG
jgi:hypothetical protein